MLPQTRTKRSGYDEIWVRYDEATGTDGDTDRSLGMISMRLYNLTMLKPNTANTTVWRPSAGPPYSQLTPKTSFLCRSSTPQKRAILQVFFGWFRFGLSSSCLCQTCQGCTNQIFLIVFWLTGGVNATEASPAAKLQVHTMSCF